MDPVALILDRLQGVRPIGRDKWKAFCPVHENPPVGHRQSVTVSRGRDGRALIHCHAGCAFPSICKAVNLTARDFYARGAVR